MADNNAGFESGDIVPTGALTSRAAAEILSQAAAGGTVDAKTLLAALLKARSTTGANYLIRPFQLDTGAGTAGIAELVPQNPYRRALIIVFEIFRN